MTNGKDRDSLGRDERASPLFSLRQVTQQRGDVTILRDLTLELPRTGVTALIGPSGAGKTSLFRLLNRLDDPTAGEVWFDGEPINALSGRRAAAPGRLRLPAHRRCFAGTVADNLRTAVALGGAAARPMRRTSTRVLDGRGARAPSTPRARRARLSGGEQQRVSLARALMTRPEVLLLDEPTSALDPEVAERLLATVAQLARERGVAVVMVTHRLSEARETSTLHGDARGGAASWKSESDGANLRRARRTRARAYLASAE